MNVCRFVYESLSGRDTGRQTGRQILQRMTDHKNGKRVVVWDLDETLIIFQTLSNGRYAHYFNGLKDPLFAVKLGRRWEKLIIQVCDDYFFYEQVENYNQPTLETWRQYDDERDLSNYNFEADGFSCESSMEVDKTKLAYRHRKISQIYDQGLETLLNDEQLQEWKELYEMTDIYTDHWLTAGRNILRCCLEAEANDTSESNGDEVTALNSTSSVNVLVTSGSLVPSLVKILLFKLNKFISHENVYSSTEVGKLQCFKWIKEYFNNLSPKFCAIGDSLDECEAAQALEWPFVKVDIAPTAPVRLPSLTLATIKRYMRIIYGDDVDIL